MGSNIGARPHSVLNSLLLLLEIFTSCKYSTRWRPFARTFRPECLPWPISCTCRCKPIIINGAVSFFILISDSHKIASCLGWRWAIHSGKSHLLQEVIACYPFAELLLENQVVGSFRRMDPNCRTISPACHLRFSVSSSESCCLGLIDVGDSSHQGAIIISRYRLQLNWLTHCAVVSTCVHLSLHCCQLLFPSFQLAPMCKIRLRSKFIYIFCFGVLWFGSHRLCC